MGEIVSPRGWIAMGIVLLTAGILVAIGAGLDATMLTIVGGVAAVLATTAGREPRVPAEPPPAPEPQPLAPVVEAIADPVLVIAGARVSVANQAARELLGAHVVGEDARTAIRHPAAAAQLTGVGGDEEPVELVGLGTADRRWEMRVSPIDRGRRLVHLVDRSGSHAAEKMRVDFVANASHELRTPLASILGYVETLADSAGEDPETRARFLKIVFDEARRMEQLVHDLMSLSRIEAEKFRAPAEAVDLTSLIEEVHAELADTHDGRGRDIVIESDHTPMPVLGDRAQLSQLLHNLVGNAMKYGRTRTPIRIAVTRDDGIIRLIVADQGDGIAPDHLPRLTERFYRVDPGRSRSVGGTGLGLAIVKHIVERHRGRFDIASKLGEGTRVTVTLRAAGMDVSGNRPVTKAGSSRGGDRFGNRMIRAVMMLAPVALITACHDQASGGAGARAQITAVGSSTVYPFTTIAAEQFLANNPGARPPVIESTGTGAGMRLFCGGIGAAHPDIENASRRMKRSEFAACVRNGAGALLEIQIGIDGVAFAEALAGPKMKLTPANLYRAIAAAPLGRPNTARTWRDVDPSLPATPIQVYGPPATSGTRDALAELIMARGCEEIDPAARALKDRDEDGFKARCQRVREDGAYVDAGENDNLIVQKLTANPNAIGVFGYSYLEENAGVVNAVPIAGVAPSAATIADGSYPGARPLYIYVKKAHLDAVPGLRLFIRHYARLWGKDGPLARRGLIAAPAAVQARSAAIVQTETPLDGDELR